MEAQPDAGTAHLPLPLPQIPSLNNTYGAILLGTFGSLMLYGLTLHQAYRYARLHIGDSIYMKLYVLALLIFDTFHTVLCMHMSYWYLVVNYFKPDRLFTGIWSINLIAVTLGVNIISCQCFFARRVYIIGHKWRIVSYLAGIGFVAEMGFAIAATIEAFVQPDYAAFHNYAWLISAAFGIAVVSNAMLTAILIYVLHQSRTGFKKTDSKIDTLIKYAVCTGFITDIFSVLALIFALIQPGNLIYTGIDLVTSKLYVNSVLAALNFRESVTSTDPHKARKEIGLSIFHGSNSSGHASSTGAGGWHSEDLQYLSTGTHSTVLDIKPQPVGQLVPPPLGLATPEDSEVRLKDSDLV